MPEKLRIAFATPEYVTESHFDGGLANYINRASKILVNLGHDVHVITLSHQDDREFQHERVMVHRVKLKPGWHALNRLTRYSLPTTLHWLNFSTQVYRKLRQLHRQHAFHVIQYPNYSSCGIFAILFLRATHVIRASSCGSTLNDAAGITRNVDIALAERLEALQYKLARNVYAPSQAMQQTLRQKVARNDVALIRSPFFVETEDWDNTVFEKFLKGRKYLLYFGRFQLHKGFHILAQALPRFLKHYPDAYVALVGRDMETNLAPSMAAFARAQCGAAAVRLVLLENLSHSQLYPVIAGSHLIALPSLIDNFPNTCLEAMGLGKVVIGTNGTSFEELISDGVNGFLVNPNNPRMLAEKMISAWVDPRVEEMSTAARQRILEFAPDKTVAALLSYYSELVNGRKVAAHDRKEDQQKDQE